MDESTLMPLTIVAAIGGACWYVGGFVRGVEDTRKITNARLTAIENLLGDLKEESIKAKEHHAKICPVIGCNVDFKTGEIKRNDIE